MPRVTNLVMHNVSVERGREQHPDTGEMVPTWTLVFVDQVTGDVTRVAFTEQVRDFAVQGLTSGILVASDVPANGQGPQPAA